MNHPHIQQTINILRFKIATLESVISTLLELDLTSPASTPVLPPTPPLVNKVNPVNKVPSRPKSKSPSRPAAPAGVDPRSAKSVAIIATMPEPITFPAIAKAGLKDGVIYRMKDRGWLALHSPGQYLRTPKFPKLAQPSQPSPTPTPDRATLEKKLNEALRARDYARDQGREEVTAIYQKEIDTLETQLA